MFIHAVNNGKQRHTTEHKNKSNLLIFMDYQGKSKNSVNRPDRISGFRSLRGFRIPVIARRSLGWERLFPFPRITPADRFEAGGLKKNVYGYEGDSGPLARSFDKTRKQADPCLRRSFIINGCLAGDKRADQSAH